MSAVLVMLLLLGNPPAGTAETKCEACHTPASWTKVVFPHERTGFPLRGRHAEVTCSRCHQAGVEQALERSCAGCHRDPHVGELGKLCESCHQEATWKGAMRADGHRRTAFPLLGAHATIPCKECHQGSREVAFSRAAVPCASCHLADYSRAALVSLDHAAAGFGTDCRRCHGPTSFQAARLAEHEACFSIAGGPHASVRCTECHASLVGVRLTGQCRTDNAACTSCHEHACATTDTQHREVPGYQCKDRKCYECHKFTP